MIAGLGLDVASVDRIRSILEGRHGERFARRICTERERDIADRRVARAQAYAARYAAKEAFAKAVAGARGLSWHDIEVIRAGGRPTLLLTGRAADLLAERNVQRLHLSLTHDAGLAAAVVVLES